MIAPLMQKLRDDFLTRNPNTFLSGYYAARQLQDGKIILTDNQGEEYAGLQDTKGNYFYLRYNDVGIDFSEPDIEKKGTSCYAYEVSAPVRLVMWVANGDLDKMLEVAVNDMVSIDLDEVTGYDYISKPTLTEAILDPEEIFKQETLLEDARVRLQKGVTLLALDFDITFVNRIEVDSDCLDRDLCVTSCT